MMPMKVLKYTEGLCWVMQYYYEGVCSWQWFYPYHYAPFASDLKDLGKLKPNFELGSPFKPFTQLMGVFPAASAHALPAGFRPLMTDLNSPISDFYPTDFEVDMNGKRYAWQGVAKLPFIDEARLLAEIKKIEHTLTEEEVRRNSMMFDMLFINLSHPLSPFIFSLNDRCQQLSLKERTDVKEKIDPVASGGMNGYLCLCSGDPCPPVFKSPVKGMEDIMNNHVVCSIYKLPDLHKHIARPLAGVVIPKKTVTNEDLKPAPVLWHEDRGRRPLEHGRQNPPGTISGRQLGEAAHRLVVNSLQNNVDRNGPKSMHAAASYGVRASGMAHPNGALHRLDHRGAPRPEYPISRRHGYAYPSAGSHTDHGHGQWYSSSLSSHHQQERSVHTQYESSSTGPAHNVQYERNYYQWPADTGGRGPVQGYSQNGGYSHPPAPRPIIAQPPVPGPYAPPVSTYAPPVSTYNPYVGYQAYGAQLSEHQFDSRQRMQSSHVPADRRVYDRPQQKPNQFAALNREANRRPQPPPGYRRH
uniref:5'-3' exoribonuclease 3 n=1 Tax=Anthurium amnicola TaxID=1678845 RepID=A0A1D1ZA72_9ARAE